MFIMGRPKKDTRLWKRADRGGLYSVRYVEDPSTWHATPCTDELAALEWAHLRRAALVAGSRSTLRLDALIDGMFDEGSPWRKRQAVKGQEITAKSYLNRQGHLDNYILPAIGDRDPRELSRRYMEDRIAALATRKKLAPATIGRIIYTLNICMEELLDQGIIGKNPLDGIKPYSRRPVKPRGAIPREALDKLFPKTHGGLFRVWKSSMWASMMCLIADTGMRPGEARALRWSGIDTKERFVSIRFGIESGTVATVKGTKTDIVRASFISARTVQELAIWRSESRFAGDGDFVFTQSGAAPVTSEGVIKAFRAGLKAAEINEPSWTPYWLRHSFATHALESLSDQELELLMGHTNIQTNLVYRHPDDAAVRRRALPLRDKLDKSR